MGATSVETEEGLIELDTWVADQNTGPETPIEQRDQLTPRAPWDSERWRTASVSRETHSRPCTSHS